MPHNNTQSGSTVSNRTLLFFIIGIAILLTAIGGAAYYVGQPASTNRVVNHQTPSQQATPQPRPQPAATNCDDSNVVGMALGGVAGGLLGHQVGKSSGKTAATVGGALGGAYLGKELIPTKNVTCR